MSKLRTCYVVLREVIIRITENKTYYYYYISLFHCRFLQYLTSCLFAGILTESLLMLIKFYDLITASCGDSSNTVKSESTITLYFFR